MNLSRARGLPRPAPDRLPLRPLAAFRRPAPCPRNPRRENRRVVSEEGAELQLSEEVDVEPGLRAGLVADGEAAGLVALDDVVGVGEIGPDSVDSSSNSRASALMADSPPSTCPPGKVPYIWAPSATSGAMAQQHSAVTHQQRGHDFMGFRFARSRGIHLQTLPPRGALDARAIFAHAGAGDRRCCQLTATTSSPGPRQAFVDPTRQNEVGLVAVVPGVSCVEPHRPLPDGRLSDHLAALELIPRQINFHAARKPVPHMRFYSRAVPENVRRQDFPAKNVMQDERCNVALAARGIVRRPSIVLFRRIETPAGSDGVFDLGERVHRTRVPTSGDIPERWPTRDCAFPR